MDILSVYYKGEYPDILDKIAASNTMQRLKNVSMDCGCDYTSFPIFKGRSRADRYYHSLGVALIVWHFTRDTVQSVAGLLHDVATPAFSHVVDFLNNDHLTQESTEEKTREIILSSQEIMTVLNENGIDISDVYDYHCYPIADNDIPRLSADRLEYTLKNIVRYLDKDIEVIRNYYDDLTVAINEEGKTELSFVTEKTALQFAWDALNTCKIYSSDPDRYIMEYLARILKKCEDRGLLSVDDLYVDEPHVIRLIEQDDQMRMLWERLKGFSRVYTSDVCIDSDWFKIPAKKRYIDPMTVSGRRCSEISPEFNKALQQYLQSDFEYYVFAE